MAQLESPSMVSNLYFSWIKTNFNLLHYQVLNANGFIFCKLIMAAINIILLLNFQYWFHHLCNKNLRGNYFQICINYIKICNIHRYSM